MAADGDGINTDGVILRILAKEKLEVALSTGMAAINPDDAAVVLPSTSGLFVLKSGSDCVLSVGASPQIPPGCIALDEAQRYNLHVAEGGEHGFVPFVPPEEFALVDLIGEVRLWRQDAVERAQADELQIDAKALCRQLANQTFGRVLAVGETVPVSLDGVNVLVRITATNHLTEEEQADVVVYHCYRGLVTADTAVYLLPAAGFDQGLQLVNTVTKAERKLNHHLITVTTNDDEEFTVKKSLLRSCISLTKAVQHKAEEMAEVAVDVDCCTFDRVLLYLQADVLGHGAEWNVDINLADLLLEAARRLGCRSLEELCLQKMGDFHSRIREYRFDEIKRANAHGQCWIIVDGMVLDVTRWLPEHPGGNTIIPAQALDLEAACFFELYHSSRESFMYLKHFYIGEVCEEDRADVPCAEKPSEEFLQQLREYTTFRMDTSTPKIQTFKSF